MPSCAKNTDRLQDWSTRARAERGLSSLLGLVSKPEPVEIRDQSIGIN